jgi:hypothetical protein
MDGNDRAEGQHDLGGPVGGGSDEPELGPDAGDVVLPGASRPGPPRLDALDTAEARALAAEREETRRLVEAGARTPDELRALAERLRAQRAREEDLWRAAVKPALKRSRSDAAQAKRALAVGGALIGCVALVLLATATGNAGLVLLPLVAVVVAAYVVGKRG